MREITIKFVVNNDPSQAADFDVSYYMNSMKEEGWIDERVGESINLIKDEVV